MSEFEEEEEMGNLSLLICLILFAIPLLVVIAILIGIIKSIREDEK